METTRQDIFTVVHKAIRALLYNIGADLQRTEFADTRQSDSVLERLTTAIEMVREHARHEHLFIFSEARCFVPETVDALEAEHEDAETKLDTLASVVGELRSAVDTNAREAAGRRLNHAFNAFMAGYLSHLHHEEQELLPATWQHFSDAEIGEMRRKIQQDTHPERYATWLRWMFSAQTVGELVTLFEGAKTSAPVPILKQMIDIARHTVGPQRWAAIESRAGLSEKSFVPRGSYDAGAKAGRDKVEHRA